MEMLPEELLIEIFTYLNFKNLCRLTLTCRTFNEIIGQSSTLMDKFRLVYGCHKRCKVNLDMAMQRKYRRIKIHSVNESFYKFLKNCGENLAEIGIYFKTIRSHDLSKILKICPNLELLKIDGMILHDDTIEQLLNFPFDSLTIGNNSYWDEIPDRRWKILQIPVYLLRKNMLVSLLKQNQLKNFELRGYYFDEEDSLANVDFQLKTLSIVHDCFKNHYVVNFIKFLNIQKSLCKVIYEPDLFEYISRLGCAHVFETVKELVAIKPFTDFHILMPQIEMLTVVINFNVDNNFEKIFPNLKSLSIDSFYGYKIVKNFTELKTRKCIEIKIPENVKTLAVKYNQFENDSLFGDDVNIRIENLTIRESNNINWLIDCFKNDRIKLKSLIIDRTRIKICQKKFLESLTRGEDKKIEKLKIHMRMKYNKNRDYVCDYHIEDVHVDYDYYHDYDCMTIPEWIFSTLQVDESEQIV